MKFIWFISTLGAAVRAGMDAAVATDLAAAIFHGGASLILLGAAVFAAVLPFPWLDWVWTRRGSYRPREDRS